ncbi:ABC transporter substrate-binding protein [Nesterenkonia halotolerans]|uniref:ABC transporter substrate-binding protein n=1 Tax=Nesterenkonia halotolerans TaxID=225325 RepID=UPI003EE54321
MRPTSTHPKRLAAAAITGAAALILSSCGGGGDGDSDTGSSEFSALINVENNELPAVLESLAADQCSAESEASPLAVETLPQTNVDQQLQLLSGQDGLPDLFVAGNAPALTRTLADSGDVLDLQEALEESGDMENIEPAAVSTIEALYGGFRTLPFEYNIEGIWYNQEIFEENGVEVPETWEDLVQAAETLDSAGVQPFSASGEQGWPLTRMIGNYIFRTIGPDALEQVEAGEASLTDPEYVEAAAAVAELGEAGYFGEGVGSIDMDTSTNEFMNGNAAMFYMGSWALGDFADEERNQIGEDAIGFMPFPNVEGGEGSSEQIAANVGLSVAVNANSYDDTAADWVSCISENYGSTALEEANRVSGFVPNEDVEVEPLVETVQDRIASTDETVLWFEALFSTAATTTSQQNAAQLVTGAITPEEFMELVQSDL